MSNQILVAMFFGEDSELLVNSMHTDEDHAIKFYSEYAQHVFNPVWTQPAYTEEDYEQQFDRAAGTYVSPHEYLCLEDCLPYMILQSTNDERCPWNGEIRLYRLHPDQFNTIYAEHAG